MRRPVLPPRLVPVVRFLMVGAVATAVDAAIFNGLVFGLGRDPVLAKVFATLGGGIVAFTGNRLWTFEGEHREPLGRQLLMFVAVNVPTAFVATTPVAVARAFDAQSVWALNTAAAIGLVAATVIRYLAYARWIFAPAAVAEPAEVEPDARAA